jgi:hypothetical protein
MSASLEEQAEILAKLEADVWHGKDPIQGHTAWIVRLAKQGLEVEIEKQRELLEKVLELSFAVRGGPRRE